MTAMTGARADEPPGATAAVATDRRGDGQASTTSTTAPSATWWCSSPRTGDLAGAGPGAGGVLPGVRPLGPVARYDDPARLGTPGRLEPRHQPLAAAAYRPLPAPAAGRARGRGPRPDRVALDRRAGPVAAKQRRAVVLHYLADLTVAEIAAQEASPRARSSPGCTGAGPALATQLDATTEEVRDV